MSNFQLCYGFLSDETNRFCNLESTEFSQLPSIDLVKQQKHGIWRPKGVDEIDHNLQKYDHWGLQWDDEMDKRKRGFFFFFYVCVCVDGTNLTYLH